MLAGRSWILSRRPFVWLGLISYPLYLWHWPLLVFFAIIKFSALTTLERALVVLLSILLAWASYRFVEIPFRFGRPRLLKVASLASAMALVALAGVIVVRNAGFDFRLPEEIRAMTQVTTQTAQWRVGECMIDLSHQTAFADSCVDRDRRPLVMLWGDSTAGALMPGLRKAQESRDFGIAQFTSSSCPPAINVDIAWQPKCRAINDKVLGLARQLKPNIVLLHSSWEGHLDRVAETVAVLKRETGARVVVLGGVPWWQRGLPNEVLRYYMLHHALIPAHTGGARLPDPYDEKMRAVLVPEGTEFISAREALCNADGCLTRVGGKASDISASDGVHLTEKGSVFLVGAIIDRVLVGPTQPTANASP